MAERAKTRQVPDISLKTQILEWWAALPEPTTRAVADLCGCDTPYVRVVVRQRKGKGQSEIDRAYAQRYFERTGTPYGSAWREASPENRQKCYASTSRWRVKTFGSEAAAVAHYKKRSKVRV